LSASPRVIIADDQPTFRRSVRAVLEADGFEVSAEAVDADAAFDAARRERPDVCLLAVLLPGGGVRAAAAITAALPDTAVVMLTASTNRDDFLDAVRAGATGYLLKDIDPERLPHALRAVLAGEAAIASELVSWLVGEVESQRLGRGLIGRDGHVELSWREWEVLDLLRDGMATADIADHLSLSPVTVRRYAASMMRKLGVSSRAEAVAFVAEHGIHTKRRPAAATEGPAAAG
jgi:DNA-binding NarL/FixJ family response regulator